MSDAPDSAATAAADEEDDDDAEAAPGNGSSFLLTFSMPGMGLCGLATWFVRLRWGTCVDRQYWVHGARMVGNG